MKKKLSAAAVLLVMVVALSACGSNQALEDAKEAVNSYNSAAEDFNEAIAPYNDAVDEILAQNQMLEDALDSAQDSINQGETPYDEDTLTSLKEEMTTATAAEYSVPDKITSYETLSVDEEAKKDELESVTEQANALLDEINAYELSETEPEIPDYSDTIAALDEAVTTYENSIQSLKQVTAPADDFVMDRLREIETITEIAAVTEDHDPNGKLNKQGGYIGCIYFTDTQVDRSELYIEEGGDNVIDVGTDGGGAVEIFSSVEDAQTRDDYLGTFDGTIFASGSHYVVGTLVIRTSDYLTGTQQLTLTDEITQVLTEVR